MKKNILKIAIIILVLIMLPKAYAARTGRISATAGLKLRTGPGTGYGTIKTVSHNTIVNILETSSKGNGCQDAWFKISAGSDTGYACSTYIEEIVQTTPEEPQDNTPTNTPTDMASMTDAQFEEYLNSQHFPETYKVKLRALHKQHPTWIFKGAVTKYTWSNALKTQDEFKEDNNDKSRGNSFLRLSAADVAAGYEAYLSTQPGDYNWYTNTFVNKDGGSWFQANRQAIAYYMDPRNFLDEQSIFMFQELTYDESYQTESVVKAVLYSNYMKQFSPYFMTAGKTHGTNPIFLAALARQEVGTGTSNVCSNGHAGVLSDGVDYTGYYNFYNIGASSSPDPKLRSLQYARQAGWNSAEKSIIGGSIFISNYYVNKKQNTLYYQKFNFNPQTPSEMWHQYTTNINALKPQSVVYFTSYRSCNVLESPVVFEIPIFSDMPESTTPPKLGNPNNYLASLTVNGESVPNFDAAKTEYTMNIKYADNIYVNGDPVAASSAVEGNGAIVTTENHVVATVKVTSGNGNVKTYTIDITREPKIDPKDNKTAKIAYTTHVQRASWQNYVFDGETAGTTGLALRTEAIKIQLLNQKYKGSVEYRVLVQSNGWETAYKKNDELAGTEGQGLRMEAIQINLTGEMREHYDIYYRCHVQKLGWLGWARNGELAGSEGFAYRMEALEIKLVEKNTPVEGYGATAYQNADPNATPPATPADVEDFIPETPNTDEPTNNDDTNTNNTDTNTDTNNNDTNTNTDTNNNQDTNTNTTEPSNDTQQLGNTTRITYQTHIQKLGWQSLVQNGKTSGTTGQALRLEAIKINLEEQKYTGNIEYRTHIQTFGWEKDFKKNSELSGTTGLAKRLEAIEIKLTGELANHYDVYYRVHAQKFGWLGVARNGEKAGTAGYAYRLEAIDILLIEKGKTVPEYGKATAFYQK